MDFSFMTDHGLLIYLTGVCFVGAGLLWWLKKYIGEIEKCRLDRVDETDRFEAVRTNSSKSLSSEEYRELAQEGVSTRYTNIRRLIFYSVATAWILAMVIPFLQGIPAYILSILGTGAAILLGIAAKPFVENMIAGVVMSLSKPVHVGDTVVIDGEYGTVQDITLMHTVIRTWDWRRLVISNSCMLNKELVNHSLFDSYRWAHVEFWVSYDADLAQVRDIALSVASKAQHFAGYEPPRFWLMEMSQTALKCWVVAWAGSPSDSWMLCNEIRAGLFEELQAAGVKPHLNLHQWGAGSDEGQNGMPEIYDINEMPKKTVGEKAA